jgi:very-short-patch-repair endonuclease
MEQDDKTKEFIRKAIKLHGDKYDYSKVEYVNSNTKVIIICRQHCEFIQSPSKHLQKQGCSSCGGHEKRNTEDFIIKSKEMHGDKYDYSKVKYINSQTNVIITCKTHGDFEQKANSHIRGMGCRFCGRKKIIKQMRSNTEEFVENAIKIHGDKYDYSKVNYKTAIEKVIIVCKEHGEFEQTPSDHLNNKYGCPTCANYYKGKTKMNACKNKFVENAIKIHGDKYDYSKSNYTGAGNKLIITCKEHGDFEQQPNNHLYGKGCYECGISKFVNSRRSNIDEFIQKATEVHGDTYDYSLVEYISVNTKVKIICKTHGEFLQTPYHHYTGQGCDLCGIEKARQKMTSNTDDFIQKAIQKHGDKYDYSRVEYINCKNNIIITCKNHGDFYQQPSNHLGGQGCPLCVNKTEAKLYEQLLPIYPSLLSQFKQDWCMKLYHRIYHLPYDFCIPELKIIIELDGPQHFRQIMNWKSPEEQQENDKYKEECANQNGYSVIRLLQEDVFYDTYDWVKELCEAIEKIKSSERITNIRLSKNGEYDEY